MIPSLSFSSGSIGWTSTEIERTKAMGAAIGFQMEGSENLLRSVLYGEGFDVIPQ